jgi:hypothetical protein
MAASEQSSTEPLPQEAPNDTDDPHADGDALSEFALGDRPAFRFFALLIGLAALALAVVLVTYSPRAIRKLGTIVGIVGLYFLYKSFHICGMKLHAGGIESWSYWAWFFGRRRFIPAADVKTIVLGSAGGQYVLTARLSDASEFSLPVRCKAARDAENIQTIARALFQAQSSSEVADPALREEAAAFRQAQRLEVVFEKVSTRCLRLRFERDEDDEEEAQDRLVLEDLEIELHLPWLSGSRAEFEDADGSRWVLAKAWGRLRIRVSCDGEERGTVVLKRNFVGNGAVATWEFPEGCGWHAAFTGDMDWDPVTVKLYAGLPPAANPPAAVFDGADGYFTLDVATPSICPWAAVALASMVLAHRSGLGIPEG